MTLPEENHRLYLTQTRMLDTFLKFGAITPDQYARSLHDLTGKMGESA